MTSVNSHISFIASQLQLSDDQPFLCRHFLLKSKYHISKPVLAIKRFSINHPLKKKEREKTNEILNPLTHRSNLSFPYCEPYNSYNVSWENLLLDQQIISKLISFFILITYLVDIVLVSWSLMGTKGLITQLKFLCYWLVVFESETLYSCQNSDFFFFLKVKYLFFNIFFWNLFLNTCSLTRNGLKFETTPLKSLEEADGCSAYM